MLQTDKLVRGLSLAIECIIGLSSKIYLFALPNNEIKSSLYSSRVASVVLKLESLKLALKLAQLLSHLVNHGPLLLNELPVF